MNGWIRHYFGMRYFMEYEADDPLNLPYEDEVAICDYK